MKKLEKLDQSIESTLIEIVNLYAVVKMTTAYLFNCTLINFKSAKIAP